MVGTSYPYIEFLPKPGDCRCIQIDANAQRIGLRMPVEVGLVGDSKKTIQLLLPRLKRNDHCRFLEKAQKSIKAWEERIEKEGTSMDTPMKPQANAVSASTISWSLVRWSHPCGQQQLHSLIGALSPPRRASIP